MRRGRRPGPSGEALGRGARLGTRVGRSAGLSDVPAALSAGPAIAVVGSGTAHARTDTAAETVGRLLAEAGAVLVCGGLGGVMAAACRGAVGAGGLTVGILPGDQRAEANPWVGLVIPTGLGELRNGLVVRCAQALVAIGGEYGTLSEVALALKAGRPVVGLDTWELRRPNGSVDDGIVLAASPEDAVRRALGLAAGGR
ncbi:MAG TPA: TIGR00725 family protein [Acidimicrobiales bacterium]|nr:TIGR00725 family protein [Acidimicrobiales bacterium]